MEFRKLFVLVSFLLALFAVAAGFLAVRAAQESRRRPRATLHVASYPPRLVFSTAVSAVDRRAFQLNLKAQEALIRSQPVLSAALRDPGVAQLSAIQDRTDPITWLEQNLEVTNVGGSEILQISMAPGSGASAADQASIINAVVHAYIDKVVNVDARRRQQQLKELKESYQRLLEQRQETMRELSEAVGSDERPSDMEKQALPRLYCDLRSQRVKLRMERTELEALLDREKPLLEQRKKAGDMGIGAVMARLEERLGVVTAREKALDEELERLVREMNGRASTRRDLNAMKDEIAQLEETARKIGAEIEALNVENMAPPRIRVIDEATPRGR
jgi:hypothetical protein